MGGRRGAQQACRHAVSSEDDAGFDGPVVVADGKVGGGNKQKKTAGVGKEEIGWYWYCCSSGSNE